MTIEAISTHPVVMVSEQATLKEAAQLMKQHNIGAVIVVKNQEADQTPCGILTDRDIMLRMLESSNISYQTGVKDIMSTSLLTIKKGQGINEAMHAMTEKGVRRAPIIDEQNKVIGIITTDDLVQLLANELKTLANLIHRQVEVV